MTVCVCVCVCVTVCVCAMKVALTRTPNTPTITAHTAPLFAGLLTVRIGEVLHGGGVQLHARLGADLLRLGQLRGQQGQQRASVSGQQPRLCPACCL